MNELTDKRLVDLTVGDLITLLGYVKTGVTLLNGEKWATNDAPQAHAPKSSAPAPVEPQAAKPQPHPPKTVVAKPAEMPKKPVVPSKDNALVKFQNILYIKEERETAKALLVDMTLDEQAKVAVFASRDLDSPIPTDVEGVIPYICGWIDDDSHWNMT